MSKDREAHKERAVRKLPPADRRVESGAIQFGDDWPGLFLRGDDAMQLAVAIEDACSPFRIDKSEENKYINFPAYTGTLLAIRKMILRNVLSIEGEGNG